MFIKDIYIKGNEYPFCVNIACRKLVACRNLAKHLCAVMDGHNADSIGHNSINEDIIRFDNQFPRIPPAANAAFMWELQQAMRLRVKKIVQGNGRVNIVFRNVAEDFHAPKQRMSSPKQLHQRFLAAR